MKAAIARVRPAKNAEWDRIWAQCSYSTYFNSREWAEVWSGYSNGKLRPQPTIVEFEDRKEALIVASHEKKFKGTFEFVQSAPAGTYGGWISSDELSENHEILLISHMIDTYPNLTWRLNPYDRILRDIHVPLSISDETHAINLREGFDAVLNNWTGGCARSARKARRSGVIIKCAENEGDWRAYFEVYLDSLRRWDTKASSRYDWGLFYQFIKRRSNHVKLWLAFYSEQVIAGALCLYAPRHVVYWHGAALESFFSLRPVNYLFEEAMKDACQRKLDWFDFNPSGAHPGVTQFKRSFGAQSLAAPIVSYTSKTAKMMVMATNFIYEYRSGQRRLLSATNK